MASIVRNLLSGLSAREKKMLMAMGATLLVMFFMTVLLMQYRAIEEHEKNIDEYESLIQLATVAKAMAKPIDDPVAPKLDGQKPVPLRTLVEKAVQKVGITLPTTKELNDKTYASGLVEHHSEVTFRNLELDKMVDFMVEVERNRLKFPIAFTKLQVTRDRRDTSQYRASMTITTYEQKSPEETGAKKKRGGVK